MTMQVEWLHSALFHLIGQFHSKCQRSEGALKWTLFIFNELQAKNRAVNILLN